MKPESSASPQPQLPELIHSLEQATLMAKQLQTTTDQNQLLQIYASLHQVHHCLSFFIANTNFPSPPEHSLSSAPADVDEPMMAGDEEEENSKDGGIDVVEERMRECFIRNKRAKRPLSPSLVTEERRVGDGGYGGDMGFDPHGNRLRALDLIYQFHG